MRIYEEKALKDFDFWSGAADRAADLTDEDFDIIESNLEELYSDGISDTELNDFFWFEFDTIAGWLGYENEEDFDRKRTPSYIDDDDLKSYIVDFFRGFVKDAYNGGKRDQIFSLADLVDFDYSQHLDDEPTDDSDEVQYQAAYEHLLGLDDEDELYDTLFDDNQGNYELDGDFPTWEEFRDEMMTQHPKNQE